MMYLQLYGYDSGLEMGLCMQKALGEMNDRCDEYRQMPILLSLIMNINLFNKVNILVNHTFSP